jgi:hypothetical protein
MIKQNTQKTGAMVRWVPQTHTLQDFFYIFGLTLSQRELHMHALPCSYMTVVDRDLLFGYFGYNILIYCGNYLSAGIPPVHILNLRMPRQKPNRSPLKVDRGATKI